MRSMTEVFAEQLDREAPSIAACWSACRRAVQTGSRTRSRCRSATSDTGRDDARQLGMAIAQDELDIAPAAARTSQPVNTRADLFGWATRPSPRRARP